MNIFLYNSFNSLNSINKLSKMSLSGKNGWGNQELVERECRKDGMSLRFATEELKDTESVVCIAITSDARALQFASRKLKNTLSVVLHAMENNPCMDVTVYLTPEVKADERFMRAIDAKVKSCVGMTFM